MLKGVDFVTSNVPGPQFDTFASGGLIEEIYGFGPLSGAAANITLFSYRGSCGIGVNTDQSGGARSRRVPRLPRAKASRRCPRSGERARPAQRADRRRRRPRTSVIPGGRRYATGELQADHAAPCRPASAARPPTRCRAPAQCCEVQTKHGGAAPAAHAVGWHTPSGPSGSWHWAPICAHAAAATRDAVAQAADSAATAASGDKPRDVPQRRARARARPARGRAREVRVVIGG